MKQTVPTEAKQTQNNTQPARRHTGHMAIDTDNCGPVQKLAQLRDLTQRSPRVQNLMQLGATMNERPPARLRGASTGSEPDLNHAAGNIEIGVPTTANQESVDTGPHPAADGFVSPPLANQSGEGNQQADCTQFASGPKNGAPIQRVIGDAGKANTGRVAFDKDYVMAKITGVTAPSYMGTKWPKDPTIYNLSFYYKKSETGYALGSDPNYFLAEEEDGEKYVKSYGQREPKLIPLRSAVLQGLENGTYIRDSLAGTIRPGFGGAYEDGDYPFVILVNGVLSIGQGRASGHTGLAQGNAVLMAGELTINAGKATYKGCRTGHYYTREDEELRGLEIMKQSYSWIKGLSPKGHGSEKLGLLAFGGLSGGTFGHRPTMKKNFGAAKELWTKHHEEVWVVDVAMHSLTLMVKKYEKLHDEEDELSSETLSQLSRYVEITGEMLRDMKLAIAEHERGEDVGVERPKSLPGYDGTDPFEEEDI